MTSDQWPMTNVGDQPEKDWFGASYATLNNAHFIVGPNVSCVPMDVVFFLDGVKKYRLKFTSYENKFVYMK